jgi:hypothetical protein
LDLAAGSAVILRGCVDKGRRFMHRRCCAVAALSIDHRSIGTIDRHCCAVVALSIEPKACIGAVALGAPSENRGSSMATIEPSALLRYRSSRFGGRSSISIEPKAWRRLGERRPQGCRCSRLPLLSMLRLLLLPPVKDKGKIRLLVAESGKVAVFKPTLFLHADWSLLTLDPSDLKASTGPSFSPLVFPLLSHVLPFKITIFRIWKTADLMCCVCPSRATSISQVLSRLGLLEVLNLPPTVSR